MHTRWERGNILTNRITKLDKIQGGEQIGSEAGIQQLTIYTP